MREVSDVVSLVRDGARLVTLTGPAAPARRASPSKRHRSSCPSSAMPFWVPLAALRDPALVTADDRADARSRGRSPRTSADRKLLLLLDNFEQVVDAAPELPGLLELPRSADCWSRAASCCGCRARSSTWCRRCRSRRRSSCSPRARGSAGRDGRRAVPAPRRPAARRRARCRADERALAEQILERLSQRLDLLKGGRDADARQRTLRATIEWSYELLDRGGAAPLRPPVGLRGRMHARRGRGGRRRRSRHAPVARRQESRALHE